MQQTAVQWLIDQLNVTLPQSQFKDVVMQDFFRQALLMEEKQQEEIYIRGCGDGYGEGILYDSEND